jgi:hypothetical protein
MSRTREEKRGGRGGGRRREGMGKEGGGEEGRKERRQGKEGGDLGRLGPHPATIATRRSHRDNRCGSRFTSSAERSAVTPWPCQHLVFSIFFLFSFLSYLKYTGTVLGLGPVL